ncbi:polyisoprenoid-binding protein [Ochrobactrum sp. POC9]|uniref:YceI family protein n=1 Tax=unclassified Ochrobactrum TaxID=239106 RepID=UPI000D707E52|nr:YceI family protein [Ochrobactrum sp. POC9]MCH4542305.1 YceI family protein [Ochrobactrum sp. A-1]PWU71270.1 polyisoprenoid-binding protein [Ochrobactrum sp. POC9]
MFRPLAIIMVLAAMPVSSHADTFGVASGHYTIQQSSHIAFTVSQVGGGGLGGSFGEFTGNLELDAQNLSRSSVSFRLRPASVDAKQSRITDFLKSSAVFDVQDYPVLTFESTRITQTGPRTARIDGMLTARGKTHGETFFAALVSNDARTVTFHVTGDVLRSPYGMDVGTPIYSNVVKFEMNLRGAK